MPNRLADSLSPYLRQHAENPVDWWPWCDEAFEKARLEAKPVFLSVGYSSCHWCHVMASESFEDAEVGAFLNENFVSIKLDREERPDVDEAYMTAVQLATGRGGWPMTLFLMPDRRPFFAGTYFPRHSRQGMPGFLDLAKQVLAAYRDMPEDIFRAADEFDQMLRTAMDRELEPFSGAVDCELIEDCIRELEDEFDPEEGGFGGAPKFPPHTALELLLTYADQPKVENSGARHMAIHTLKKMALGGFHDVVSGGFHRYSTDEMWLLPHFEKMLYDNAQLLTAYAKALRLSEGEDRALFQRVGDELITWLESEMMGGPLFFSAIDADSEHEEGKHTTWTHAEVVEAGGQDFAEAYGVLPMGNFQDEATRERNGQNVLYWQSDDSPMEGARYKFHDGIRELAKKKASRIRPETDDKAIAAWNGLMCVGLIEWSNATGNSHGLDLAEQCLAAWAEPEELPHQITRGTVGGWAFLDDYACLTLAAFRLAEATGNPEHRAQAMGWYEQLVRRFYDEGRGGFYFTESAHENLFGRSKNPMDNAWPSPNAVAARCAILAGDEHRAKQTIELMSGWMHRAPHATEAMHLALLEFLNRGTRTIANATRISLKEVISREGVWSARLRVNLPKGHKIFTGTNELTAAPITANIKGEPRTLVSSQNPIVDGTLVDVVLQDQDLSNSLEITFQVCSEAECGLARSVFVRLS